MTDEIKSMSIVVDDGLRRVPIMNTNGDEIGVFAFRPTDIGIIDRYNKLVSTFDAITEPLEALATDSKGEITASEQEQEDALKEAENRLYAAVNELFDGDMAGAFFGNMHPFSPVNGAFYCAEALRAVGEFISAQFDTETAKFSENVKKYTNRAMRRNKK